MIEILDIRKHVKYTVPIAIIIAIIDLVKVISTITLPKFDSCNFKKFKSYLSRHKATKKKDNKNESDDDDDSDEEYVVDDEIDEDDGKNKSTKKSATLKKFKSLFKQVSKKMSKNVKPIKNINDSILNVNAQQIFFDSYDVSHFYHSDDKERRQFLDGKIAVIVKLILTFAFSTIHYMLLIGLFLTWAVYDISYVEGNKLQESYDQYDICWIDDNGTNCTIAYKDKELIVGVFQTKYDYYCIGKFSFNELLFNISRIGGIFVVTSLIYKNIDRLLSIFKQVFKYCKKKLKTKSSDLKIEILKKKTIKFTINVACNMLPRFTIYIILIVLYLKSYGGLGRSCYAPGDFYKWFESFRFLVEIVKVAVNFQQEYNAFIKSFSEAPPKSTNESLKKASAVKKPVTKVSKAPLSKVRQSDA